MSEPLVNESFNEFPIDYFKIIPENFLDTISMGGVETSNQILSLNLNKTHYTSISPDDEGRIYDQLRQNISLDTKDTTVINAGVGQGKTYSILRITKEYFENHSDTHIVIAVPYVSLVEQYVRELVAVGIPESDIYKYDWLDPSNEHCNLAEQLKRRIHIVTVNCLLGNAGENAIINSAIKRKYLEDFPKSLEGKEYFLGEDIVETESLKHLKIEEYLQYRRHIKESINPVKKKIVVFVFDEIHDAIPNFKADNLYYLLGWSNVVHKIFVISATFNDASLVVIRYLSNLTNEQVKIIDSEKIRIPEKQSELYLHFNNSQFYKKDDRIITNIIKDCIDRGKEIDILSYSKTLVKNIYEERSTIGSILKDKYGDNINLCVSELKANQRAIQNTNNIKRFNPDKCNSTGRCCSINAGVAKKETWSPLPFSGSAVRRRTFFSSPNLCLRNNLCG